MAEDAFDILATTAILTRRHACNEAESRELAAVWFVRMLMSALHIVRALLSQEVNIAQFELLNSVDFGPIVVLARWIDPLSSSIACDDLVTVSRLV